MIVKLIVVKGKPEGKVIPLAGPVFRIGRGEACQLRPNSEQVSREHSEFTIRDGVVSVRDLGSRNGTHVNGKVLTGPCQLKDRDLVQVGPLTFAVSIEGAVIAAAQSAIPPSRPVSLDEVGHDEIDSWLVADSVSPTPDRPSGVFRGDTVTVTAYKDAPEVEGQPSPTADTTSAEFERLPEGEFAHGEGGTEGSDLDDETPPDGMPEEFIDESNPFYAKPAAVAKQVFQNSSDAAGDILRKMMERRKASKSS